MLLFFDTETTGKLDFKKPVDHPSQPRMVQLATILTDDDGGIRSMASMIIRPNGWTIPVEASNIHGITTEIAENFGVDIDIALSYFSQLCSNHGIRIVAHNIDFDQAIIKGEMFRLGFSDPFHGKKMVCTMKGTTGMCQIPSPYGRDDFKWPSLKEAYGHFHGGQMFDDAHDAMADAKACMSVYFKMLKHQVVESLT